MSKAIEVFKKIYKAVDENPAIKLCMPKAEVEELERLNANLQNAILTRPFTYRQAKKQAIPKKQKLAANFDFTFDAAAKIPEFIDGSILFRTAKKAVIARMSKRVKPGKISYLLALKSGSRLTFAKNPSALNKAI
jgi:hypothetical protein